MFTRIARLAITAPRRVLVSALLLMVGAGLFGAPVMDHLSGGGFRNSEAESWYATEMLADTFGQGDMQLVVSLSSEAGAHTDAVRAVADDIIARIHQYPFVTQVHSAWTAPPQTAASMFSSDGGSGLIVAGISGGENGAQKNGRTLLPLLEDRDGVTVTPGGEVMTYIEANDQSRHDLLMMEAIALPVCFVILVWVFGGLFAAAVPLAVGGFALLGTMSILRGLTWFTEVSIFSLNLAISLGLALAIDYTLLIVSRYRDEIADGADPDTAVIRTMTTAGRTVLFSALTVSLGMAAMALFPMYFLKSLAYAGVAVVVLAAGAAVVVTPAALVLLGGRLDSLDMRRVTRRLLGRPEPVPTPITATFWYRTTKTVLRRAIPIAVAATAVLVLLGLPFAGVTWGYPDDRVLPTSSASRQVGDQMRDEFTINALTDVTVVLPDVTGVPPTEIDRYAADLSRVADVAAVSAPSGTFVSGVRAGPRTAPTGIDGASAFLTVTTTAALYSDASERQLDNLHAVSPPDHRETLFTGRAQINRDSARGIADTMPAVLVTIAVITFVLLFLLTGSVVLPVKAVLLNVLSLTASFGALVWIFQDGHLGALGTTATGTMVAHVPALLFCLAFGLSMDYEVFLISRIREYWLAQDGADGAANDEAVALGIARTGRVVTAAALLMAVSFSALIAADVSIMKMFGLGLTLAVLADASLVRLLLLPALMRLLGGLNWWAPAPLRRLHDRIGISEGPRVPRGGLPLPVPFGASPALASALVR